MVSWWYNGNSLGFHGTPSATQLVLVRRIIPLRHWMNTIFTNPVVYGVVPLNAGLLCLVMSWWQFNIPMAKMAHLQRIYRDSARYHDINQHMFFCFKMSGIYVLLVGGFWKWTGTTMYIICIYVHVYRHVCIYIYVYM